jgi:hypothetical protein
MAFELHRTPGLSGIAASAMAANTVVGYDTGDTQAQFVAIATVNVEPAGITRNVASNAGDPITVYDHSHVCRVTAIASLGAGADIGVASTNGALGAITGASGSVKWALGKSLTAAAAGEVFSLSIRPRQLGGLA